MPRKLIGGLIQCANPINDESAPVEKIKLVKEGNTPSALIEMEMTRAEAEALARRIHGRMYQGRELRAWVPLMDW